MWARKNGGVHVAISVFFFLLASSASAQGDGDAAVERAREQFTAGVSCMEEEDWSCAEAQFRAALELHPAATTRYNLASALFEQGHYSESVRLAQEVLDDPEADQAILDHASTLREQVQEDGAIANVTVAGAPDDAELRVDGYAVPRDEWEELPVAPGTRRFSLHRDGELLTESSVEASAGTPLTVTLTWVGSPADAAQGLALDFDALLVDPIFWGVVAGGAALLITIIVIIAVVAGGGVEGPIEGDFEPAVLRW